MRPATPFTERQNRFLSALQDRLREMSDPHPKIITHEDFAWEVKQTKRFGRLPTLEFKPYKAACRIKWEVIQAAGLEDMDRNQRLDDLAETLEIPVHCARDRGARLFNAELDNLMFGLKKHLYAVARINALFAREGQTVADPIELMQRMILPQEYEIIPGQAIHPREEACPSESGLAQVRPQATYELEMRGEE